MLIAQVNRLDKSKRKSKVRLEEKKKIKKCKPHIQVALQHRRSSITAKSKDFSIKLSGERCRLKKGS